MTASSSCNLFAPNYKPQSVNQNTKSINNLKGENTMEPSEVIQTCILDNNKNQSDQTQVATTGFHHGVPVGIYLSKIVAATTRKHPEGEHDVIKIDLEIQSPAESGHILTKYYNLTSKESVQFFRREMKEIGFPLTTRADLETLSVLLPTSIVNAHVADHPSGNQVIYLKGVNSKKRPPKVDPNSLWS